MRRTRSASTGDRSREGRSMLRALESHVPRLQHKRITTICLMKTCVQSTRGYNLPQKGAYCVGDMHLAHRCTGMRSCRARGIHAEQTRFPVCGSAETAWQMNGKHLIAVMLAHKRVQKFTRSHVPPKSFRHSIDVFNCFRTEITAFPSPLDKAFV